MPAMAARAAPQPHPSAGQPPPALTSKPSTHQHSIRSTRWQVRPGPDDVLLPFRSKTSISDAAHAGTNEVGAVGAELKAGTNCGLCRPEISRVISDVTVPQGGRAPLAA